jgi:hypothetical protein
MKLNLKYNKLLVLSCFVLLTSCVEEIPIEPWSFEEAIVIEATITDEEKIQQINLSRTIPLNAEEGNLISNAEVKVVGNIEYDFEEVESGIYQSISPFAATPGVGYQLIVRIDGEVYESTPTQLPQQIEIDEVKANRVDVDGENGVAITLSNQAETETPLYYRHDYTETFKFTSNFWTASDLIVVDGELLLVPKLREEYTCYRTQKSQDIILANTNTLSENSVSNLLLTFINSKDPRLSRRYSILVNQYSISRDAYTYFEILKELSGSDNVFAQSQPGFFAGNISNVNDPEEKIVGFFDVASVSTKRIYLNYEDFYESESESERPSFVDISDCDERTGDVQTLISLVQLDSVRWLFTSITGEIFVVPRRCVDCNVFGTNEVPDFWED